MVVVRGGNEEHHALLHSSNVGFVVLTLDTEDYQIGAPFSYRTAGLSIMKKIESGNGTKLTSFQGVNVFALDFG